jgi:hypothetical protein
LPEAEVQRLYRVVHIYSLGFHQVIQDITLHAMERRQLLCSVWKAFSQLWEDALQVPHSCHDVFQLESSGIALASPALTISSHCT